MKMMLMVAIGVIVGLAWHGIGAAIVSNSYYGETGASVIYAIVVTLLGLAGMRYLK